MARIYLAGPMTGIKDFNHPLFNLVAARLRDVGHFVFNPAECNPPDAGTGVYRRAMAVDCAWVCSYAEMIALLPGWQASKGAAVGVGLAACFGLPLLDIEADAPGLLVPAGEWKWPGGNVL